MEKAIVVFGSTMGNTEDLARKVADSLAVNYEVVNKNVTNTEVEELEDYDVIVFGSSTWGAGELQDDFLPFANSLSQADIDLSGKKGAVFGPGDTGYGEMFCQAVDTLEGQLEELGINLVVEGFKWDGSITSEAIAEVDKWAQEI
ncbi:flavodoxin [Halobacteroides halobius DSM 5150]|uniref:Flavodoxin n=1 Tax=Halobacteroides halobius (strain ATCC 35273 / DSM 5150 / MD-1) TaxID=748449 RepID=L0K633_HALHC|nr:flavodoxin domain-containing protein [Halobacteroides halobius]AGB40476.1 flavodoxin [Halobacteroides halobius DSM 5150]